jgi:hypothetical protein
MRQVLLAVLAGVVVAVLITLAVTGWGEANLDVLGLNGPAWRLAAAGSGLFAGIVAGLALWAAERNRGVTERRPRGWRGV